MRIVDANIVLRYLLDDDNQLASQAASILEKGAVHLPFEVLAEVVYVMQGVYSVPRDKISTTLGNSGGIPGTGYLTQKTKKNGTDLFFRHHQ